MAGTCPGPRAETPATEPRSHRLRWPINAVQVQAIPCQQLALGKARLVGGNLRRRGGLGFRPGHARTGARWWGRKMLAPPPAATCAMRLVTPRHMPHSDPGGRRLRCCPQRGGRGRSLAGRLHDWVPCRAWRAPQGPARTEVAAPPREHQASRVACDAVRVGGARSHKRLPAGEAPVTLRTCGSVTSCPLVQLHGANGCTPGSCPLARPSFVCHES